MIRSILAAAGVLAIISTGAMAETDSATTTKIIRTNPDGTAHSKTVIRRHVNRYGQMVTKKKTYTEGLGGSTITHSRTIMDPAAGGTTTITRQTDVH